MLVNINSLSLQQRAIQVYLIIVQMQEFLQDIFTPSQVFCPQKHKGRLICFNPYCKQNAIICGDPNCQNCSEKHNYCINCKVQPLFKKIVEKIDKITPNIKLALQAIDKVFEQAIEKLSIQREYYKDQYSMLGLTQNEIIFLRKIKHGSLQQMAPKQFAKIVRQLGQTKKWGIDATNVENYWKRHTKEFESLFGNIKTLAFRSTAGIQSKIISDTEDLCSLFPKKIKSFSLLFRASDNNFSVNDFHKKLQKKQKLLVLAKTQYGKVIGGYTPLTFQSGNGYLTDKKGKSFLFSLSNKQIYPLKKIQNAIQLSTKFIGPNFGVKDFSIGNASDTTNSSVFSIGNAYGYPEKYKDAVQAIEAFTGGSKSVNTVKVSQWEVYQIS